MDKRLKAIAKEAFTRTFCDKEVSTDECVYAACEAVLAEQQRREQQASSAWVCAKCGKDAPAHVPATSECVWQPTLVTVAQQAPVEKEPTTNGIGAVCNCAVAEIGNCPVHNPFGPVCGTQVIYYRPQQPAPADDVVERMLIAFQDAGGMAKFYKSMTAALAVAREGHVPREQLEDKFKELDEIRGSIPDAFLHAPGTLAFQVEHAWKYYFSFYEEISELKRLLPDTLNRPMDERLGILMERANRESALAVELRQNVESLKQQLATMYSAEQVEQVRKLREALEHQLSRMVCCCKMLGWVGKEPPCDHCRIKEALGATDGR